MSLADLWEMPATRGHAARSPAWRAGAPSARWRGVPVRDLLERAGAGPAPPCRSSRCRRAVATAVSELAGAQLGDPDTLLALDLDGEPLHLDHGYPVRLIGPNRPGVLQTKWVGRLVVR